MRHPLIAAHSPRIILIAPPPLNEHLWWPRDQSNGYTSISRLSAKTKEYADAVVQLGADLGIPVVNLWKAFMDKTKFDLATWKTGDALPGAAGIPQNDVLVELMYDGMLSTATWMRLQCLGDLLIPNRPSLQPCRL